MSSSCNICSKELSVKEINAYATPCGHIYHKLCLTFFVADNEICPNCKKMCSLSELIRLKWEVVKADNRIEIMAFNKASNEQLLENVSILTNQIDEKDCKMEQFQKKLQIITDNYMSIAFERRELKRKNQQLKFEYKKLKMEKDDETPNQDSIIAELNHEILVLKLLIRDDVKDSDLLNSSNQAYS